MKDGYYQKLVADTLNKREITKLAKEIIELKNRKPIIIQKTVLQPKDTIKVTEKIYLDKDSLFIEDYYPNKENYFLKYSNKISLKDSVGLSNFKFKPLNINIVITENNGVFEADIKTPEYLKINKIDIQSEPLEIPKKDNFGILVGTGYGKNFQDNKNYINGNVYIRYKKIYLGLEGNTNNQSLIGVKVEF